MFSTEAPFFCLYNQYSTKFHNTVVILKSHNIIRVVGLTVSVTISTSYLPPMTYLAQLTPSPDSNPPVETQSQSVQVIPQPSAPVAPTAWHDGAYGAVILTCAIGVIKMVVPALLGVVKSKQDAAIQAQADNRNAELNIESTVANSMVHLLEQNASAQIAMNKEYMGAVTDQLTGTLGAVVTKLGELSIQMGEVSKAQAQISHTQGAIAETQMRTLELVARIETDLNLSGKSNTHRPDRRKSNY